MCAKAAPPIEVRVPIPRCREPFVNTPLLSLGVRADGREQFWISTYNNIDGCTGVLLDDRGEHRLYRLRGIGGAYSAVAVDADTLWLSSDLAKMTRLSLASGEVRHFATGAPSALTFEGMPYDPDTGKVFALAHPGLRTAAVSFDIRRRKPVRVYEAPCEDAYMRSSFANGDGTYTVLVEVPQLTFLRWDPKRETVEVLERAAGSIGLFHRLAHGKDGRAYIPRMGWFDPRRGGRTTAGPRPQREMTWFARRDNVIFGARRTDSGSVVESWNLDSGAQQEVANVDNALAFGFCLTRSGKLVGISVYGDFTRHDPTDGRLEISRRLPVTGIQRVDCLVRLDAERMLGTPFITQRFWEVNLRTKRGFDCGRAAPSGGEILKTWRLRRRVYMAEYAGGRLVEFDPARHAHFPENPRVVAAPPRAMRPLGATNDGRHLYYSCSAPYGHLGSTVTRYDTRTGESLAAVSPLPDMKILSLWYQRRTKSLLASASIHADCKSAPPTQERAQLARLSAADLSVLETASAPDGVEECVIYGPLGRGRWLCESRGRHTWGGPDARGTFVFNEASFSGAPVTSAEPWPEPCLSMTWAGKVGLFVWNTAGRIELWDMRRRQKLRLIRRARDVYRVLVDGPNLYLIRPREILVLDDALANR